MFNVHQFFVDGTREDVLMGVDAERAVKCAVGLASSVGAQIGTTVEVLITDDGDDCNWHWKREDGIVFPPEVAGRLKIGAK